MYNKYNNTRTVIDGVPFASRSEARRFQELQVMQRAGLIHDLRLQTPYKLIVNGLLIATYVSDFTYIDKDDRFHLEDVKGVLTREYRMKRQLMQAIYGITVEEIRY